MPGSRLRRAAFAAHRAGRFEEALDLYARAREQLGPVTSATPAPVLTELARVAAGEASTRWARGELAEAAPLAAHALDLAERCGDHAALADAHVADALLRAAAGDRPGNARAYDVALEHATAAGERDTVVRILTNIGSRLNEEGQHEAAVHRLEQALTLLAAAPDAVTDTDGTLVPAALAHHNMGDALLGLGRLEEALHAYRRAESLWSRADSPMRAHAAMGIGEAYRLRGLPTQAAAAYRDAVAVADVTRSAQVLVPALAGLSRTLVEDDPPAARESLSRCLRTPAALGDVGARLAAGWLALDAGDTAAAVRHARDAEDEAGRRRDPAGQAEALQLHALAEPAGAAARLAEAAALWDGVGNSIGAGVNALLLARVRRDRDGERDARRWLRALGVSDAASRVAGPLRVLGPEPSAEVQVRVLGRLAVLRDGEPLPVWSWQSRKCRDVVKILAAHPRGIGREALTELLWPGEPGAGARLSVVLSTLRALLDPGREHGADVLLADRSTVALDLERVEVDAVELERRAGAALRFTGDARERIARLEAVVAAYTGPFAEDDPYADWARPVRDRLAALVDDVRRALAQALLDDGRPAAAVPWYLALVAVDPYDEPAHRGLLRALHADRRHGQVRRHYADYRAAMLELGETPVPLRDLLGTG